MAELNHLCPCRSCPSEKNRSANRTSLMQKWPQVSLYKYWCFKFGWTGHCLGSWIASRPGLQVAHCCSCLIKLLRFIYTAYTNCICCICKISYGMCISVLSHRQDYWRKNHIIQLIWVCVAGLVPGFRELLDLLRFNKNPPSPGHCWSSSIFVRQVLVVW